MNWIFKRFPDVPRVNIQPYARLVEWIFALVCIAIIGNNISIINAACYSLPKKEKAVQQAYGWAHIHEVRAELFYMPQWAMGAYMQFNKKFPPTRIYVGHTSEEKAMFKQLAAGKIYAIDYPYPERLMLRNQVGMK